MKLRNGLLTLSLLLLSCGTLSEVKTTPELTRCPVPTAPQRPDVRFEACGEKVCIYPVEAVELARYIRGLQEVDAALAGCNLVERV